MVIVLFETLLALGTVALMASSGAADETGEEPPLSRPDFRFEQPRVTLGFRGGWAFHRANGEIYDFLSKNLTISSSDFDAPAFALDASLRVISWLDFAIGIEYSRSSNRSKFRGFVNPSGAPIKQKTTLTQVPLVASLKLYPMGRGRQVGEHVWVRSRFVPYLGGGVGGSWYELEQSGDFVDAVDLSIFKSTLNSDAWAFSQHAFVGFDLGITRNFGLVVEARYYWADADLKGDFIGFDDIELDGARLMVGFSWRL